MEQLRAYLFNHFRVLFALTTTTLFCLMLLMIRLKVSQSYFLLFLVWNLFLAFVPFAITFYLKGRKHVSKMKLLLWFGLWLLFLPNAPYILTDLIHLGHTKANLLIFDFVVITSFACCGLLLYLLSVRDMMWLLRSRLSRFKSRLILWVLPFLTGFGIYLGRFLRWNSWDAVRRPHKIIRDVWEIISYPSEHQDAWVFTFSFGIGLGICYQLFRKISFFQENKTSKAMANSE